LPSKITLGLLVKTSFATRCRRHPSTMHRVPSVFVS